MAYTVNNYRSKKELKAAMTAGEKVRIYSPGPFGCKENGTEYLEGPHYPEAHVWYAQVEVKNGLVVRIK